MPIPLAPIAGVALKYGAVAFATYAVTKGIPQLRRDQRTEDILDNVEEGIAFRRDKTDTNATARYRRVIRLSQNSPGLEIDFTTISRLRFRKVD